MPGFGAIGELAVGEPFAASGPANYTITAQSGTYAITGQSAVILRSKVLTASAGSYTITGQSATLLRSKVISAQYGTYSLTGQSADIVIGGSPIVTVTQTFILIRSFTRRGRF